MPILLQNLQNDLNPYMIFQLFAFVKMYLFAGQTFTGGWLGPENAVVRRDPLQCGSPPLLAVGVRNHTDTREPPASHPRCYGEGWFVAPVL